MYYNFHILLIRSKFKIYIDDEFIENFNEYPHEYPTKELYMK